MERVLQVPILHGILYIDILMVPGIKLLTSTILEAIQIFSIDVKHLSAANHQRDGAKPNTVIPYIPQIDSWGARGVF